MTAPLDRRRFFGQSTAAALPLLAADQPPAPTTPTAPFPGLILRESQPPNLEMPFGTLDRLTTPTEWFFVRCHFPPPAVDAKTWRLKVEGAVERPFDIGYEELRRLPGTTKTVTLECAGNSRVFLVPKPAGVSWQLGAVGNADWTGVPLAALLERAGVKSGAVEVVLEGADSGTVNDEPKSPGPISFARSIPVKLAQEGDVLLAHRMNGAPLTRAHGFPLRAVVPGWYGMASVKWLTRVVVTDRPFQGYWQTLTYSYFERVGGQPVMTPVTEIQVKSAVARPGQDEVVAAGRPYRVAGAAWAGTAAVTKVEVSTDGGKTWAEARLEGEARPYAWRLWEYEWRVPATPGRAVLMARATDSKGRTQPMRRDPDLRSYMISHVLPVEVDIR
jgi:DMSO/TMAO reductase YedYZ molybdopterin-dependent catalytic subunit